LPSRGKKARPYLADTPRNSSGRPKPVPLRNGFPTLDDLGITWKLAPGAAIGGDPGQGFRLVFGDGDEQEWEITTRLLLYYFEPRQAAAKNQQRIVGGRIDDLIDVFSAAMKHFPAVTLSRRWLPTWTARWQSGVARAVEQCPGSVET
jgi:hypothetical protein